MLDAVKDYLIRTKNACLTRRERAQLQYESCPGIRTEHWQSVEEHCWITPRVAGETARYDLDFERCSGKKAASALVGWCLLYPPQLSYKTHCHNRHQVTAPAIYKYLLSDAKHANQQVEDFAKQEPKNFSEWSTSVRKCAIAPNRELAHWKIACAHYLQ